MTDAPAKKEGEDSEAELDPRKAGKKAMKAERKDRRKQKKDLKMAFKN